MSQVLESFWELNRMSVDAEGIAIPHCVYSNAEGGLTAAALALPPAEIYVQVARFLVRDRPDELVFGIDRFTKPGQGIETADALSVSHWVNGRWRFGMIAYCFSAARFDAINWGYAYWNQMLANEMNSNWKHIKNAPHREPSPAMVYPVEVGGVRA